MGFIDEMLPTTSYHVIQIGFVLLGILFMVFLYSPLMIIPAFFLGVAFYCIRLIYLATAQDVKRLEGIGNDSFTYLKLYVLLYFVLFQLEHPFFHTPQRLC